MKKHRPFDGATYSTLRKEQKYWSRLRWFLFIGVCCTLYLFQYSPFFCIGYVIFLYVVGYYWATYIDKGYNSGDSNFITFCNNYEARKYCIDLYKEEEE